MIEMLARLVLLPPQIVYTFPDPDLIFFLSNFLTLTRPRLCIPFEIFTVIDTSFLFDNFQNSMTKNENVKIIKPSSEQCSSVFSV